MEKIKVKPERCKGCSLCIPQCPHGCIQMSEETNDQGHRYPIINTEKCVLCSLCCKMCPDLAIEIK